MILHRQVPEAVRNVAILPGTFNPPTVAHEELARAALGAVDAVVLVLPRAFPHKDWSGASFADRLTMLERMAAGERRFGIGIAERGLYIEMAEEAQELWPAAAIHVICGRDAAERILSWPYEQPGVAERMFERFGLLVAPRAGLFTPPEHVRGSIRELTPTAECETVSATEVRRRIREGLPWEHLVPAAVREMVARLYS